MEGFYDEWCISEQERLRELYLQALQELVACHKTLKDYGQAIICGKKILAISPLREEIQRELMYLYYLAGDRNAALLQYELCRQVLEKELQIEPLPETKILYQDKNWSPAAMSVRSFGRKSSIFSRRELPFTQRFTTSWRPNRN